MRNLIILIAAAISFASCGNSNSISGVITGAEGKTIYLESLSDSRVLPIDSTVVGSDGSFSLKSHDNLPLDFYRIYFKEGNRYLDTRTLKTYESILDRTKFFRVHKSHIINLTMLVEYLSDDGHFAVLKNGLRIPVARNRVADFVKLLKDSK